MAMVTTKDEKTTGFMPGTLHNELTSALFLASRFKHITTMAGITYKAESEDIVEKIRLDAKNVAAELVEKAHLKKGQIVVVGCSTSETVGNSVGSHSIPEIGKAIHDGLNDIFGPLGIFMAAQCCEHLNRAIIIEHEAMPNAEIVNVVPRPKAGGSFASACHQSFRHPVAVEKIKADAGIDIGATLIGMHLKEVAVPLRIKQDHIGKAIVIVARTRPKFIGGERACYDENLKDGYPEY